MTLGGNIPTNIQNSNQCDIPVFAILTPVCSTEYIWLDININILHVLWERGCVIVS
jgi:hypothetical protein